MLLWEAVDRFPLPTVGIEQREGPGKATIRAFMCFLRHSEELLHDQGEENGAVIRERAVAVSHAV